MMDLYDVMRTTFAAREFIDEPIQDEVILDILENARFAPSGGNRQGWRVIVVKDLAKREALMPLINPVMRKYTAQVRAGENPFNTIEPTKVTDEAIRTVQLPPNMVSRLVTAPVLLIVLIDLKVVASMDSDLDRIGVISGASIYPFVWNILLAARNEGLGGTLTTFLAASESQARELFDIPNHYALAAMLPIGKPVKQLSKLTRRAVSEFTSVDSFNGKAL